MNWADRAASAKVFDVPASTMVALPMLILFVVFQRQIMDSIKASGLK